jgi:hypothetical protein
MENKSDILIILFRFHQKGLSEFTEPFYLRIRENLAKEALLNIGLESKSKSVSDLHTSSINFHHREREHFTENVLQMNIAYTCLSGCGLIKSC